MSTTSPGRVTGRLDRGFGVDIWPIVTVASSRLSLTRRALPGDVLARGACTGQFGPEVGRKLTSKTTGTPVVGETDSAINRAPRRLSGSATEPTTSAPRLGTPAALASASPKSVSAPRKSQKWPSPRGSFQANARVVAAPRSAADETYRRPPRLARPGAWNRMVVSYNATKRTGKTEP